MELDAQLCCLQVHDLKLGRLGCCHLALRAAASPHSGLEAEKEFDQLEHARRLHVLREVNAAGMEHSDGLFPRDRGRVSAGGEVESTVSEWQRELVGIGHDGLAAWAQPAGGLRNRLWGPGLCRDRDSRESVCLGGYFAADLISIDADARPSPPAN